MKKSTLIMILSLVLAVALGVGGTLAYLQDTDEDVNVMTLGSVYITQNEQEYNEAGELVPFTQDKPMYPAVGTPAWNVDPKTATPEEAAWRQFTGMENVVDKYVTVTNTGKSDAYVRTLVALEMGELDINAFADVFGLSANIVNGDEFKFPGTWKIVDDNVYTINDKTYNVMTFEHQDALVPGETTIPSILQMYLKGEATTNETMEKIDGNGNGKYDVLVLSQAVQTQGFADATTALSTAFGEINQDNVQEWFANIGKNIGSPGKDWPNNNPPAADVWDGTIPETMPETMELTLDAVKNQGGTITVKDAEALVYLSKLKDDFIAKAEEISGYDNYYYHWEWEIELTSDIDLKNIPIDPIDASYFGAVNGNGHIISNVVVKDGGTGLFKEKNSFSDLTLFNVKINAPAAEKVGALTSTAGLIKNVTVKNAEIVGKKYVGAIVGKSSSVIDCTVQNAVITASDKTVGGMVGYAIGDPDLASAKNNTVNNVKVTGAYNVGGLFGQAQNIDLANNTVKNTEVTSTTALPANAGETEKRADEVAARQHGHYTETGSTVENVTVTEQ